MSESNPFETAKQYEDRSADDLTNEQLRDAFFEWAEKNTKESTANFYRTNFKPFYQAAEDNGSHLVSDSKRRVVKEFLQNEAETLQPKTVGHRHSAISRFYSVLKGEVGLIPSDQSTPTENLSAREVSGLSESTMRESTSDKSFHYLEADEITELVDHAPDPSLRNRAILLLMANTGLRASEVREIRVENIDLEDNSLVVRSPKLSDSENDSTHLSIFWNSQKVSDAIDSYLNFGRPSYPFAEQSPYLFVSQQSEQVGYELIRRVVRDAAEDAGLQGTIGVDANGNERSTISTHVLRHSFAMECLNNGMNINEVKEALHHQKIETTMMYLREHEESLKKAIQTKGPRLGFD